MNRVLTRKEAAELLGISVKTLDQARSAGQVSYIQYTKNGCVFFTEEALQEYIARSTRRANPVAVAVTYRKPRKK